jgi:hypothetical protein
MATKTTAKTTKAKIEQSPIVVSDDISLDELEALIAEVPAKSAKSTSTPLVETDELELTEVVEDDAEEEIDLSALDDIIDGLIDEDDVEEVANDIEAKEAKLKRYEEQEVVQESEGVAPTEESVVKSKLDKPVKEKAKVVKEKTEKVTKLTTHSREEVLVERAPSDFYLLEKEDLSLTEEEKAAKHELVTTMIQAMNVKVGMKCLNIMAAINGRAELSVFLKIAIEFCLQKQKAGDSITQSELVQHFASAHKNKVKAYNVSTATPQATNCIRVFTDLRIILKKAGGEYEVNENSLVMEKIKTIIGKTGD